MDAAASQHFTHTLPTTLLRSGGDEAVLRLRAADDANLVSSKRSLSRASYLWNCGTCKSVRGVSDNTRQLVLLWNVHESVSDLPMPSCNPCMQEKGKIQQHRTIVIPCPQVVAQESSSLSNPNATNCLGRLALMNLKT